MEPWNDFLKQDYNNTQDTSVSTPNFSTTELQNAAPAGRSESQVFLFCYLRYNYTLILVLLGNLSDKLLVCVSLVYGVAQHYFSL